MIARAMRVLAGRLRRPGAAITNPDDTRLWLTLNLANRERESFAVVWLDKRNRVIGYEELFHGTIDATAVYPREVVKSALRNNAAAVIFSHNHPSGVAEPSYGDETLTILLRNVLASVGVRVLDHVIVGGAQTVSMSELNQSLFDPVTYDPPYRARRRKNA